MRGAFRKQTILVYALLVLCIILVSYIVYDKHSKSQQHYELLDPAVSEQSIDEFSKHQETVRVSYRAMREQLVDVLNKTDGHYALFFEDLGSGATIGINERDEFIPRSLFKLPTAAAVLKAVEEGNLTFSQKVEITSDMLDSSFGTLYKRGAGQQLSVAELLKLSMTQSDNTANNALRSVVPFATVEQARLAMGVPYPKSNVTDYTISPKNYASIFQSLYQSGYLRRPYSEYLLELLSESENGEFIRAGVPSEVLVAHKIGEEVPSGQYHDCGIVYHPERPYILCIMSRGTTETEARFVIPLISKIIYEQVSLPPAHLRTNT